MLHVREAEQGALAGGIPEADSPTEPHRGQDEAVDELLDTMKKLMK